MSHKCLRVTQSHLIPAIFFAQAWSAKGNFRAPESAAYPGTPSQLNLVTYLVANIGCYRMRRRQEEMSAKITHFGSYAEFEHAKILAYTFALES